MYKQDLALNNLQELICHKTQPTNFILYLNNLTNDTCTQKLKSMKSIIKKC